jgi:hypothetical protein
MRVCPQRFSLKSSDLRGIARDTRSGVFAEEVVHLKEGPDWVSRMSSDTEIDPPGTLQPRHLTRLVYSLLSCHWSDPRHDETDPAGLAQEHRKGVALLFEEPEGVNDGLPFLNDRDQEYNRLRRWLV